MSDFIEGKVIYNLDGRLLLNEFINALEEFEKEVINVSRRGIVMHDMHQENIILTPNNSLVAIDTDMFEVTYDYEIWVLRNNMKELGETIISELVTLAKLESEKLNNLINSIFSLLLVKPNISLIAVSVMLLFVYNIACSSIDKASRAQPDDNRVNKLTALTVALIFSFSLT